MDKNRFFAVFLWRAYIKKLIRSLKAPYALYGAGLHSETLVRFLRKESMSLPVCVFDQNPTGDLFQALPCMRIDDWNPGDFAETLILLSSDSAGVRQKMAEQIKTLNPSFRYKLIDPYYGLPDGPYLKET